MKTWPRREASARERELLEQLLEGEKTPKELLTEQIGVGAIHTYLSRLVAKGLVERERIERGKQENVYRITDAGREEMER